LIEQLQHLKEVSEVVKGIQKKNRDLFELMDTASARYPQLEIGEAMNHLFTADRILAKELEQIGDHFARINAKIDAAQQSTEEAYEDGFDRLIARCFSDLESGDDIVADGSTVTVTLTKENAEGVRRVTLSLTNDSEEPAAGTAAASTSTG